MLFLRFRSRDEAGRIATVYPSEFMPLGITELRRLTADPAVEIDFNFVGDRADIEGQRLPGSVDGSATLQFSMSPAPYALVRGGWLPIPFVLPQRFLVDRNVVSTLRRIRTRGPAERDTAFCWWINRFEGGDAIFNPLPYAYEGATRSQPGLDQFVRAFEEGRRELTAAFPKAQVVKFKAEDHVAAHSQLLLLSKGIDSEVKFLLDIAPRISQRVSRSKERAAKLEIFDSVSRHGIRRHSPIVLAAMSAVFDDIHGRVPSIGRKLLKPRPVYTAADAYNAVSDIRHIEVAALSGAAVADGQFALCTNDRALAEMWCALSIRGTSTPEPSLHLDYKLGADLLPRLGAEEIERLAEELRE